jgi:hypothetical protein
MGAEGLIIVAIVLVVLAIAYPTVYNETIKYINDFLSQYLNILPKTNQTNSCTPSCSGKVCGDNGCGGSCGSCTTGQYCSNNQCISNPTNYEVTCTTSDTDWKCGSYSSCSGLFYTRKCCSYHYAVGNMQAYMADLTQKFYCSTPVQPKGSSTGQIYVYLASVNSLDSSQLNRFSQAFRQYLYTASSGILDNVNFALDANADYNNPRIAQSSLGTQVKATLYLSDDCNVAINTNLNHQFNSNINWLFSIFNLFSVANFHASYPVACSNAGRDLSSDGCWDNSGTHNICFEAAHELAHTLFGCEDYDGDIMRSTPDMTDNTHYPPICLERIKSYMPQIVAD